VATWAVFDIPYREVCRVVIGHEPEPRSLSLRLEEHVDRTLEPSDQVVIVATHLGE
jgi:hypothetical protein